MEESESRHQEEVKRIRDKIESERQKVERSLLNSS